MSQSLPQPYFIYFGDRAEGLSLTDIKLHKFSLTLQDVLHDHGLQRCVALDQIHDVIGACVDAVSKKNSLQLFVQPGDFLITDQKNVGLAVVTADCIPLVLYDPVRNVIAVVHAGWKGSLLGVVQACLQQMQQKYQTQMHDVIAHFGPSGRGCCYEVSQDFMDEFCKKYDVRHAFEQRHEKLFFDNTSFVLSLLKTVGILAEKIYTDNAFCTICNPQFNSYRRDKENAGRQVSMAALLEI